MPLIFWLLQLLIVVSLVIASLLLFVCFACVGCVGCVVDGFLSLRMIATKRKGAPCWRVPSLFLGCGLLYAHKLVQVISGFIGSKISPSGCGVLYFTSSLSYFSEIAIFNGFACFIYFDFNAAPVTYCERGGWCKSCHIGSWFYGFILR